jgi:hypothetical protein
LEQKRTLSRADRQVVTVLGVTQRPQFTLSNAVGQCERIAPADVLKRLANQFVRRQAPGQARSDDGPEFTAKTVRVWLGRVEMKTPFTEPGNPWEIQDGPRACVR